jgi:hypothetical protein
MYHIINALNVSNQAHIYAATSLYNVATIGMTWALSIDQNNDKE